MKLQVNAIITVLIVAQKKLALFLKIKNLLKKIVDEIVKYPPEEINISGGDPLLVFYDTRDILSVLKYRVFSFRFHKYVVEALKKTKVACKIIVNPDSIVG